MPYESDQLAIRILHEDGDKILITGAYEFVDAKDLSPLRRSEEIIIGSEGRNVARKFVAGISFASFIPKGGRMLIYAPDGTTQFDSLIMKNAKVEVKPNSFIIFIGRPGAIFRPDGD